MPIFIAVAGKGGTGKTTFTSILIKYLVEEHKGTVLAVDADPNANLSEALGIEEPITISELLEQTKNPKTLPTGMSKEVFIEYKLQQSLSESKNVDLLVMGGPQGSGCYCYPNDLLRKYLERLTGGYDFVVIDNEAGMEHISRKIIPKVDYLFVISDASARSVRSAGRIHELVGKLSDQLQAEYLLITKTQSGNLENLAEEIRNTGIKLLGDIPYDRELVAYDETSKPLFTLPGSSLAVKAVNSILQKAGI